MRFLARLPCSLPLLALALALPACNPTVIGCSEDAAGGGFLPDGSFEEQPSLWSLAPGSSIDGEQSVCGGASSLRMQLDQGLGSMETTRSVPFSGLSPDREYEVAFHYRFEHCKEATLFVHIGSYEEQLHFDGNGGTWGETSLVVPVGSEPVWVDVRAGREGNAADHATPEHDGNLMWLDDFTIRAL